LGAGDNTIEKERLGEGGREINVAGEGGEKKKGRGKTGLPTV